MMTKYGLEWLKGGIELYDYYNRSHRRKRLESEADSLMIDGCDSEAFIRYLCGNFLPWMHSRNGRKKFEKEIKDAKWLCAFHEKIINGEAGYRSKDTRENLQRLEKIRGVGPVLATAMLTLINPVEYGIVCQYTVNAICAIENKDLYKLDENNALRTIEKMREIKTNIYGSADSMIRVRDIDKALWGYGKHMAVSREKHAFYLDKQTVSK